MGLAYPLPVPALCAPSFHEAHFSSASSSSSSLAVQLEDFSVSPKRVILPPIPAFTDGDVSPRGGVSPTAELEALFASPHFGPICRTLSPSLSASSSVYSQQQPRPASRASSCSSRHSISALVPPAILPPNFDIFDPAPAALFSTQELFPDDDVPVHPDWYAPRDEAAVHRTARSDLEAAAWTFPDANMGSRWSEDSNSCDGGDAEDSASQNGRRPLGVVFDGVVGMVRKLVHHGRDKRKFQGKGSVRSGSWPGCEGAGSGFRDIEWNRGMGSIEEEEPGRRYTHSVVERKRFMW